MTEYEVVDGRELALTVLRSFGLISRNANPYREDPAGPEVPVPAAQLLGPRLVRVRAACRMPAVDRRRRPVARPSATGIRSPWCAATGAADAPTEPVAGLRLEGDGVVLSAVRRRGDWLEVRLVERTAGDDRATLRMPLAAARAADLLGRPGAPLAVSRGRLELDLGAVGDPDGPVELRPPRWAALTSASPRPLSCRCNVDSDIERALGSRRCTCLDPSTRTMSGGRPEGPVATQTRSVPTDVDRGTVGGSSTGGGEREWTGSAAVDRVTRTPARRRAYGVRF